MNYINSILLLSLLLLYGCTNNIKVENKASESSTAKDRIYLSKAQFENSKMVFASAVKKEFSQTVSASGIIDVPPQSKAEISAFWGGYIKSTSLLIGDKVKLGDCVVTLENPEFINMQQAYLETAEKLAYLKADYERQKTMVEENITSQKSFLKAESEYKTAMARNNSLKKNLQMLNINPTSVMEGDIVSQASIYSPIDGYVTQILVNTGTYISPADKIMEVMNTDHIHLKLKVFEKDLLQLKKGQKILFKVPEAMSEEYQGEVHLVGSAIDPISRLALLHGHINNDIDVHFSVGMFVEAKIIIETNEHAALPVDAVVELEGKKYVLMLESEDNEGYTLKLLEVEVENNYNGFTSFKSQLPLNKQFLTKGGFVLLQE